MLFYYSYEKIDLEHYNLYNKCGFIKVKFHHFILYNFHLI